MNVWTFSGRLGQDAELRTTQSGDPVASFSVANDVGYGERKTTQWVRCSLWGRRAEALAEHLTKGKLVFVSGEVRLVEYEKRDGSKGANLEVRVAELDFGGGGKEDGGERRTPPRGDTRDTNAYSRGKYNGPPPDDLDDEIPF